MQWRIGHFYSTAYPTEASSLYFRGLVLSTINKQKNLLCIIVRRACSEHHLYLPYALNTLLVILHPATSSPMELEKTIPELHLR
jgi:hypothetical protein